jgi:DNA recombination protein RmuC
MTALLIGLVFILGTLLGAVLVWVRLKGSLALGREAQLKQGLLQQEAIRWQTDLERTSRELDLMRNKNLELERSLAASNAEAGAARTHLELQKQQLSEAKQELRQAFQALSGEALQKNADTFMLLARQNLQTLLQEAKGDFSRREEVMKTLLGPLQEALRRYESGIQEIEQKRHTAYGSLEAQIKGLLESQRSLQKETGNLVNALRKPEVKGNWGQLTLRRVVELAGMSEYCDFEEQVTVSGPEGLLRPDMLVRLPAGREIVIDSKVATNAYLEAIEAPHEETRQALRAKHAAQVRKHMQDLAKKSYWSQFKRSPEMVVMFLPGEAFSSMALTQDGALYEDALEAKVVLATPSTLMALLKAIAYGWRQEQMAHNAQEVARLGKELMERFTPFLRHLDKTGNTLRQTVEHFNAMTASLDQRVMVSLRKFQELGVTRADVLQAPAPVERLPLASQSKMEIGN